jgi:hypothetical protein
VRCTGYDVVHVQILEFVDEELGEHIEEAMHWTSVAILSLCPRPPGAVKRP